MLKKIISFPLFCIFLGGVTFTTSAAVSNQHIINTSLLSSSVPKAWFPEKNEIILCKSRLSALKTFNPVSWKKLSREFNNKMEKWYLFNDYKEMTNADSELTNQYESNVQLTCLKIKNSMNDAMLKTALR
ncbi:hypothetical protein [Klebsiella aerogenes]|uniref:hypothetical protein n=1 Tax=Klebsiella aerogenes TaxID=548 RepID=UPI0012DD5A51|nr:hypothetical protein [Klebsiella aerogenes]EKZ5855732.1 hypothetical protein [Klebsiella aerogenes]EKZ6548493.1 hypothetical protein [Klebsiella aerogenes]EKZ6676770.1 hypothetical protein [Klebsiella aerogenes]